MKYVSHKIEIDEWCQPLLVITVAIPLEVLQDMHGINTRQCTVTMLGEGMLDVLEERKKWKATNEIQATPASAIKDAVTKG